MQPDPTIMGLVLAGGQSRRFGSDKALARLGEQTLLDRAIDQLSQWSAKIAVSGRDNIRPSQPPTDWPDHIAWISDWPGPQYGPLGGLAAGLRHARNIGCTQMLSIGVDSLLLPDDLPTLLSPAPACLASQPIIGLWPVSALPVLSQILQSDPKGQASPDRQAIAPDQSSQPTDPEPIPKSANPYAIRNFAEAIGARRITLDHEPANINSRADLATLHQRRF